MRLAKAPNVDLFIPSLAVVAVDDVLVTDSDSVILREWRVTAVGADKRVVEVEDVATGELDGFYDFGDGTFCFAPPGMTSSEIELTDKAFRERLGLDHPPAPSQLRVWGLEPPDPPLVLASLKLTARKLAAASSTEATRLHLDGVAALIGEDVRKDCPEHDADGRLQRWTTPRGHRCMVGAWGLAIELGSGEWARSSHTRDDPDGPPVDEPAAIHWCTVPREDA